MTGDSGARAGKIRVPQLHGQFRSLLRSRSPRAQPSAGVSLLLARAFFLGLISAPRRDSLEYLTLPTSTDHTASWEDGNDPGRGLRIVDCMPRSRRCPWQTVGFTEYITSRPSVHPDPAEAIEIEGAIEWQRSVSHAAVAAAADIRVDSSTITASSVHDYVMTGGGHCGATIRSFLFYRTR